MKTVLLAAVSALCAASLHAQTNVEITFRVDMNVQIGLGRFDPAVDYPVVRGTINGWGCSEQMLESEEEDGVYELSVQVADHVIGAGEYKFNINCGKGAIGRWEDAISNRRYTVTGAEPDEDGDGFGELVLETVFFDDAVGGADVELLFRVDMSVQIVSGRFDPIGQEVFVRGSLNGWGCSEPLLAGDDGLYDIEIRVPGHQIGTGQYKFNIGCGDSGWEDSIGNRRYTLTGDEPDEDGDGYVEVEIPVVYFDDAEPGPDVEILFRVDMTQMIEDKSFIPEDMTLHVGGTFNGWDCSAQLVESDDNIFEIELRIPSHPLGAGRYKFNIGCLAGSWEPDIQDRTYVVRNDLPDEDGDGFGEITPAVAFYNALESPFLDVEMIFQVDMSVFESEGLFDPASETVVVRGELNAWDCTEAMTPVGDGLYEVTVELPGVIVGRGEYKFNVGCLDVGWEDSIPNRQYFIVGDEVDTDDDGLVEVRLGPFYFDEREPPPGVGPFLRGDCGQAGNVNISSGILLLTFLFSGGGDPGCFAACDADGDGRLDVTTAIYIFNFLFLGGGAPSAPFPDCGFSESEEDVTLGCADGSGCI